MIEVRGLTHKFGVTKVLKDINLSLAPAQTLALVGPSGCGKSTLLKCIAGLISPSEGDIHLASDRLSFMFQEPRLLPWKSAAHNLTLCLKAQGINKATCTQAAKDMATSLGLSPDDLKKYPHELSGGMQSRVALGRALISSPKLLLLDEPFAALDIGLKLELYALLRRHIAKEHCTVLMITHDLMEAVRLADRILMMVPEPGRILGEFSLPEPHSARSEAWVWDTCAKLMQEESVRQGFGLPEEPAI